MFKQLTSKFYQILLLSLSDEKDEIEQAFTQSNDMKNLFNAKNIIILRKNLKGLKNEISSFESVLSSFKSLSIYYHKCLNNNIKKNEQCINLMII